MIITYSFGGGAGYEMGTLLITSMIKSKSKAIARSRVKRGAEVLGGRYSIHNN